MVVKKMANPLARVIMNNIAQNSNKVHGKSGYSNSTYKISGLDKNEEQILLNVMNKKATHKPTEFNNSSNYFEKVKLEDLVKGGLRPSKSTEDFKKSNTMMTLDELAGKVKKTQEEDNVKEKDSSKEPVYVKTGVINKLEAYIPKVSLDSIGKKGSLL